MNKYKYIPYIPTVNSFSFMLLYSVAQFDQMVKGALEKVYIREYLNIQNHFPVQKLHLVSKYINVTTNKYTIKAYQ